MMKKYILHILYSARSICSAHSAHSICSASPAPRMDRICSLFLLCGMSLLGLCTACTEQDELPSAGPQPLTIAIGETVPFVEATETSHTRVADSGTALTWENGDKIYLAATITLSGTTTYAYSTATYSSSGSTGTWSAPDPAISVSAGSTVKIEALYAKGTLSGNILTLADNSIVTKATATGITVSSSTTAIPLKFQSALVRFEVVGISAHNTVTSRSFETPQSVEVQPSGGSFSITSATVTTTVLKDGVYYLSPGLISLATYYQKSITYSAAKANESYYVDMGSGSGTIGPDGEIFVKP